MKRKGKNVVNTFIPGNCNETDWEVKAGKCTKWRDASSKWVKKGKNGFCDFQLNWKSQKNNNKICR